MPVAARPTTARFIPDGPGLTGPRNPAVPNCRKPLKDARSSVSLPESSHCCNCAAVTGSGSSAIQAFTSCSSERSICLE